MVKYCLTTVYVYEVDFALYCYIQNFVPSWIYYKTNVVIEKKLAVYYYLGSKFAHCYVGLMRPKKWGPEFSCFQ